jgi:hypothetical protein
MALPLLFIVGQALVRAATPAIASVIRSQGGRAVKKLTKALTKKYGQPKTISKPPKITAKLGQNKTTGTSVTKPSGSGGGGNVSKPKSTSVTTKKKAPQKKVLEGEVIPPKKNVSTKVNKRKGETIEGKVNKPLKVGGANKLKTAASVAAVIAADKLGTKSGTKSTKLSADEMPKPRPKKKKTDFGMGRVDSFSKSRVRRTDDMEGGTAPVKMKKKDTKTKKPKKAPATKVKKKELKKVVKKKRSNIVGSSSYDAQFTYDKLKERGGKKFAEGRMSKENLAKVKKR